MGKVKKTASSKHDASVSPGFAAFISKLCSIPLAELPRHLSNLDPRWPYPRGDLYHWINPLNRFDDILAKFNLKYGLNVGPQNTAFGCTQLLEGSEGVDEKQLEVLGFGPEGDRQLVQSILEFTRLLLEKCGNRTLYSSSDRLNDLLNTSSILLLQTTLRVALCLAHRHREKSRGFFAPVPYPYYSLDIDKLQTLSAPVAPVHHPGSRSAPVSPVKSAKGKEKAAHSTNARRPSSTVNPNDFRSLCGMVAHAAGSGKTGVTSKASHKDWSGFAGVQVLYCSTASMDKSSPPKDGRLGTAGTPLTPTPSRLQTSGMSSGLNRSLTAADRGHFVPATEVQEESTDSDLHTLDISSPEMEKSSIDQLLSKYRGDLPQSVHYQLLHKLRTGYGLLSSPESRRLLLVTRLLAIANLACVLPEDKFAQKVFGYEQEPAKRQRFIQQCTSLLQDSKKDAAPVSMYVQSAAMEVLGALLRQKATSAEVCTALGISSSHGVLLLLTQKAVTNLKSSQTQSDSAEGEEWRELVFSMLRTALESTAYMLGAGTASVSPLLVVAYVSGLEIRSETALRVQLKILELFKSFYHHVKDGLNPLSVHKAFDAMSDLLEYLVKDALEKTSGGNGFPARFKTPSTDFEIPYLHQIMIRAVVDLINDIGGHQGAHADRVLRAMIDSPTLLGALRSIVDHASQFGPYTWSEVVRCVCGFLHNEPTSYTMIAEAGLSRSLLEAVTLQPIPTPRAAKLSPSQPGDPSADASDEQVNGGDGKDGDEDLTQDAAPGARSDHKLILDVPARNPQGILASSDAILNIAQAFGAICLTTAGHELFQSSGALQKFFEIFESPAHVKVMKDGPGLSMLGATFDELVRHHPNLRVAVESAVIVMVARVRYAGRLLSSDPARGPQLWPVRDGQEAIIHGDHSASLYDLLPECVSSTSLRASREDQLVLPNGNVLRLALRPDSSTDSARKFVEETDASRLSIYDYVSPATSFLINFFENQSLCSSFMEQGATDLVLDLITMPLSQSLKLDMVHGISTNELPSLVHMMAETKPHLVLPELLNRALFACKQLDHFTSNQPHGPESYFAALISQDSSDEEATGDEEVDGPVPVNATGIIRALTALVSLVLDLTDIFDSPLYSNRSSGTPFTQVNLADMYAELCQALAKIAACCTREDDAVRRQTPATWLQAIERQHISLGHPGRTDPGGAVTDGEAPDQHGNGAQHSLISPHSHPDGLHNQNQPKHDDLPPNVRFGAAYRNVTTLRAILSEVPSCVTRFLHMLSRGLEKKKMDTYQKQNTSIVANALASALAAQIDPYFFTDPSLFESRRVFLECRFAYLLKVLANLKQPFFHVTPGQGVQCMTWVVLAFKNAGGLRSLDTVGTDFFTELESCETSEELLPLMTSANAGLKICLELLDSLTSAKTVIESSQSTSFKSVDPTKSFHFLPSQLLLELRMQSLPLVRRIWDSDYMSQASSTVVESLVSILRHVLSGEHESDAYRNAHSVPEIRPYDSKKFALDATKVSTLAAEGVEDELAREALYRCNNSSLHASEYCVTFTGISRRRRNPVPPYDIDPASSTTRARPNGSLSATGADNPPTLQGMDALGAAAESVLGQLINGSAVDEHPGHTANDEEDEDIDIDDEAEESQDVENPPSSSPMSIHRLLNRDDAMSTDVPIRQESAPHAAAVKTTIESPHLAKTPNTPTIFTVDSIQAERESIRQDLADRCLNLLSSHAGVVFDLSELIVSGAKKLPEDAASSYRLEVSNLSIQCLLSLQEDQITATSGKKIAATAHLLALLLQDQDFYKKSLELLKESFDSLLEFVRTSPAQGSAGQESYPWIGPVLLIVEKMLSNDAEPVMVTWQAPKDLNDPAPATYQDHSVLTPEQKAALLDNVLAVLPTIGKDKSLALSVARVLVVLTRHGDLANVVGERRHLQRLSVMVKQLSSNLDERLQSALMLILRHIIEDDETLRQIMSSEIIAHMSGRGTRQIDTTAYVRDLYPFVLRSPEIFVEVTNDKVKLHKYETTSRPQTLVLKPAKDTAPLDSMDLDRQPRQDIGMELPSHDVQPKESIEGAVDAPNLPKASEPKAPVVVNPDGVIHFLLADLLNYKDVEDSEASIATNGVSTAVVADAVAGNGNSDAPQGHASDRVPSTGPKKSEKTVFKAEDHPIHVYRCFILQSLTELLHSYNRTKIEFINFSRKADPMATTPSKPRSGVLNYLLNVLVTTGPVETEDSVTNKKKALISEWAMKAIVALCSKTGESGFSPAVQRYPLHPHIEDNDDEPDLAFVRRFVLEHAIKAFKDATVSPDPPPVKYARIVGLAELFNKLLSKPSGAEGSAGMHNSSYKVLSKMMFEKNLISVLTASLAEIDLTFAGAKRVIKCILRPLHELTTTASRLSLTSTTPVLSVLGGGEEEVISSASSSVSELDDDREATPDFFRNSSLRMSEPNHQHQSTSESEEEDEEEDEEMFEEEEYADEMDYGEPPVNDGEVVSDEELEEQMGVPGPLEGIPGDIPMDIAIVMTGGDHHHHIAGDSEGDDNDDGEDDDEDDDDDDDDTDDEDDEDDDDDGEGFTLEVDDDMVDDEINGDEENHSLADGPGDEREWQDQEDGAPDDEARVAANTHVDILNMGGFDPPPTFEDQFGPSPDALLQILQGGPRADQNENGGDHYNPDMLIPIPHHHSDMLIPMPQHHHAEDDEDENDDDDENEEEEMDDNEDLARFNEMLEREVDEEQDWSGEETPPWLRRPRHVRGTGALQHFGGRHGRAGDVHHVTGRPPRHMPPTGNTPDDGTNPLLQRHGSDQARHSGARYIPAAGVAPDFFPPSIRDGLDHVLRVPSEFDTLLTGLPFANRDGGRTITGHGGMLDALMRLHGPIRHVHQGHGPPRFNVQLPMSELRTLLEGPMRMPAPTQMRDDAPANRLVLFSPTVTAVRWQEEAKLLFGNMYVDKTHRVVNALLAKLVPPAIEEERIRRQKESEEKAKLEEEARLERERLAKEREEAEQKQREEEEAARRRREEAEREAAAAAAAVAAATPTPTPDALPADGQEATAEPMEDVQTTEEPVDPTALSDGSPAAVVAPRVYTTIRGRQLDITGMSIDAEYLEALPEEFREEVIAQQYATQREQAQEEGGDATAIDPDFLDALPAEIRDEIRQAEIQAQRRRDREAARRQVAQAGGPAQPEEMDNDSFLATLDPALRRAILAEQPPEVLQQLDPRHAAEGRAHARHLFRYQGLPVAGQPRGDRAGRDAQRDGKKQIVQMIDKAGVATLLRLMFLPQQGSIRQNLQTVLRNVCGNRQTRFEVITLFLFILKEGSGDVSAVERSLANLSLRAKASASTKTPLPLKRTLSMQPGGISDEITPLTIIQQCLDALKTLSRNDSHVKSIFLREVDLSSSSKSKSAKKGKGKEIRPSKFPLNDLISLLDRKLIMESSTCLQMCSELLAAVTSPLVLLLKKEKTKPKTDANQEGLDAQPSVEAADPVTISTAGEDAVMTEATSLTATEEPALPMAEASTASAAAEAEAEAEALDPAANVTATEHDDEKAKRIFDPPVVPDHNLQLVVGILVAQECSQITFNSTLESMASLSYIPGAKPVFREELISQAQALALTILADLEELLPLIQAASSGTDLQGIAMSKFSPAGSDQVKLLRVLTALGHLYDPKRLANQEHAEGDDTDATNLLHSSYEKLHLAPVWKKLSECLVAIREKENMLSFATILISLIESLMTVCKNTSLKDSALPRQVREQSATSPEVDQMSELEALFFTFTTEHRKILNEIVRQNPKLMQGTGSFALLVKNPKVLEFDNKRSYFAKQIQHQQRQQRHVQPPLQISVRRSQVFRDSYRSLYFKSAEEMKYGKLSIRFQNEEGVDAGGVTRDWYSALARGIFNPDYALWQPVAADKTTFHPSLLSYVNGEHLSFFKFIGRIIGKALHEGRVLDCHFSRAVYKQLLGRQTSLKDMESLDMDYYKSLLWILENPIDDVITEDFSVVTDYFGQEQVVDLVPNGRNIPVTDENKQQYVQALVEHRLVGSVKEQLQEFVQGFHGIIPLELVSIFNEQELELLISGLPEIDVDDWKANTEYHNYSASSQQIQWFWRAVKSFSQPEKASLLQFITGTSKVPLNGFRDLEGMHGVTKMNIHRDPSSKDRLPSSHTCFNQIDLPEYDNYETLKKSLLTACELGGNYFGFA